MRLFTGIAIPPVVTSQLEQAVALLRPAAALRWTPAANLHITTKFIGAWPDERLQELQQALGAVPVPGNLEITISRFGYYPNPHTPRIIFAGVRAPALEQLHRGIEDTLEPLGCAREHRPYSPHLTLAKIGREDIGGLRERVATLRECEFGVFTAAAFHLYQSNTGPEGSVYTRLASWPLAKKEALSC